MTTETKNKETDTSFLERVFTLVGLRGSKVQISYSFNTKTNKGEKGPIRLLLEGVQDGIKPNPAVLIRVHQAMIDSIANAFKVNSSPSSLYSQFETEDDAVITFHHLQLGVIHMQISHIPTGSLVTRLTTGILVDGYFSKEQAEAIEKQLREIEASINGGFKKLDPKK